MLKTKKSKLLATMLCATVVAGLYAGPVMADDKIQSDDSYIRVRDGLSINPEIVFALNENQSIKIDTSHIEFYNGSLEISKSGYLNTQAGASFANGTLQISHGGYITSNEGGEIGGVKLSNGEINGINLNTFDGRITTNEKDIANLEGKTKYISVVKGSTTLVSSELKVANKITAADVTTTQNVSLNNLSSRVEGFDERIKGNADDIGALKDKTTAIEYTPGSADSNAQDYQKMGTTTIKDKLKADIFSANQGTIGGVTMVGGAITAGNGNFIVKNTGDVEVKGSITSLKMKADNVFSRNYNLESVGADLSALKGNVDINLTDLKNKTAGINKVGAVTTVEGVSFGKGRINANGGIIGDVTFRDGKVNGIDVVQVRDAVARNIIDINELQDKTNDISYNDGVTEIGNGALAVNNDGYVTINQGMLTADIESGFVTMGNDIAVNTKDGIINANNFQTNKGYDLNTVGEALDELDSTLGQTNKNVAGIKREGNEVSGYTTTIEGTTKFDENGMTTGTINAANGSFQVEEGNGKTVVAGSMIYSKNQNGSYGILDGNQLLLQGTDGSKVSIINGNIETSGNILANGSMTAEDFITKDGVKLSEVNDNLKNIGDAVDKTNANVAGITREEINGDYVTTIEGAIRISESGYISLNGDNLNFTYQTKDGIGIGNLGALANKVTEIDNRLDVVEDKTQNINSDATHGGNGQTGEGGAVVDNGANTGFDGDVTVGGDVNANGGSFTGDVQVGGSLTVGGENGTAIDSNGMTVGDTSVDKDGVTVGGENGTSITKDDVVINKGTDNEVSLSDVGGRVDNLEQGLASANNRIDHLEDRIDKVGAMSAAIANLRTMGYDPTAPTEIAVGIGQYRSETGAALGLFHYPNKDFMLSLSVSTSGDEVMGGIGATWKFGRKTPEQMLEHEKEKAAKAKLAKAEAMKKAAAEAKVAAQQAKHAQMAAERAAK